MNDVGEQFKDDMLKGLLAWKSVHARGLLRWGFVVLEKPVGKATFYASGFCLLGPFRVYPKGKVPLKSWTHLEPSRRMGGAWTSLWIHCYNWKP